ncbi:MAG: Ppx/GppA phosphatase family protein [Solirubrobacteraceae bacterium]
MRVATVDIGTNSTRLLIADVDGAASTVIEIERRSTVTRLGDRVDADGRLSDAAIERTVVVVEQYVTALHEHRCEANLAVLTSAVRDAENGNAFSERVRALGLDARVLSGEEEAQLTFLGAMSGRESTEEPTVVIDVGGGSTEFVLGSDGEASFHTSIQAGVVRMSERHISNDPPQQGELRALALDVRTLFVEGLPERVRGEASTAIAVAGTATSAAAIDQALFPYDPEKVDGYRLTRASVDELLTRLARMDEAARRRVVGLHPDRAPTIVAGMILLGEGLAAFGCDEFQVSERDILYGGALRLAGAR